MKNLDKLLEKYAKLCVKVGINIKEGQPLVINAPIEGLEFVRLLSKNAYELGASEVYVNWSDEVLTKLKYKNSPMEVFENYPKWKADSLEDFAKRGAGFISISSDDPELLKEMDPKKVAAANKSASIALKEYRKYTMNDINPWLVISIATRSWAKKVFPKLEEEKALKSLWDAIFKATRIDQEDPIKAWEDHMGNLKEKVDFLNNKKIKSLHYTSKNGTDLKVELPIDHIWAGGGSITSSGVPFAPNMPTEEVYTMPDKYGVDGVIYSTKPLNYGGNLIDEFKLYFEKGKVVDFSASVGEEVLKDLFAIDEGAKHLGEVALVPFDSPISNSNIIFMNTLFDENASCHFAFGKAYPTNIKGGEDMTDEELEAHHVNNSLTHVDFMVGDSTTSIVATTLDGKTLQIFKDGNWAF
ncbi:aminopeptidase [Tissierella creatinophila]|uniref:Aminopeptidase 2 n=1 Tax=Tissierella creatinophila DSM 6911 TaxID=1123403 RepID=A0A1U7M547_TISCR|nr:aminopeptidase [Tissierella creatinophila]OLS02339.1 aminopeptidase 2 [Tissierella creatinophila DSM 6911]